MSEKYELREFIKENYVHTEDFDEPQSGKMVYDYQMCPEFDIKRTGIPLPLGCYYCRYGEFSYYAPVKIGQTGICNYPEDKKC